MTNPQQIGDMLNMRTAQTAHHMNIAMHELSKQNAEENKLVRMLASQSTRDTRSMKVVALISSIFLPATFVAVCDWDICAYHHAASGLIRNRHFLVRTFLASKTLKTDTN
jgi:hypothetical protein